jgi:hypothetical protein
MNDAIKILFKFYLTITIIMKNNILDASYSTIFGKESRKNIHFEVYNKIEKLS